MKTIQCQRQSVTDRLRAQQANSTRFSLAARLRGFVYAFNGVVAFFRQGHNAKIHLFAAAVAITLSVYLTLSKMEWAVIIFSIILVLVTEMINTTIEKAMDFISKDYHYEIKLIKDIAAGAVLLTSLGSLVAGCIVFIPKIIAL